MNQAEIISSLALAVSLVSLGISAHFGFRDKGKLKATSKYFPASEYGPSKIVVTLVNTGRRPIVLRLLGGTDKEEHWSDLYIGDHKSGLVLNEHGHHEISLSEEDLGEYHNEEVFEYDYLWVEDSLGKKYVVKDSKSNISKLRKS